MAPKAYSCYSKTCLDITTSLFNIRQGVFAIRRGATNGVDDGQMK